MKKTRKIQTTADCLDRLATSLFSASYGQSEEHLSEEDFVDYTMELLQQPELQRVNDHLASCPKCFEEMERMLENSAVWFGEQGRERLGELRRRAFNTTNEGSRVAATAFPSSSEIPDPSSSHPSLKVVGVGGAGGNAINTMIEEGIEGVEFIAVNTDVQDLRKCNALKKIQIGASLTSGLGAGANPLIGRQAANEDREKLQEIVENVDMLFIAAGLGGGTGTGASPVIAELAKNAGVLTVAVVTKPFEFEGGLRAAQAEDGIRHLRSSADALITVSNQKLLDTARMRTTLLESFKMADRVLYKAVQCISDLVTGVGRINVDFADVKTVMSDSGDALMGIGICSGKDRAKGAVHKALCDPLLERESISEARYILVNFSAREDISTHELDEAMQVIYGSIEPTKTHVLFGFSIGHNLGEMVRVVVIATGLDREEWMKEPSDLDEAMRREESQRGIASPEEQTALEALNEAAIKKRLTITRDIPAFMRIPKQVEEEPDKNPADLESGEI